MASTTATWVVKLPNVTGSVSTTGYTGQCMMDSFNMSVYSNAECVPGKGINSNVVPTFSSVILTLNEDSAINPVYQSVVKGTFFSTVVITGLTVVGGSATPQPFATITLTKAYVQALSCTVDDDGTFRIPNMTLVFEEIEFEYKTNKDGQLLSQGSITYDLTAQKTT